MPFYSSRASDSDGIEIYHMRQNCRQLQLLRAHDTDKTEETDHAGLRVKDVVYQYCYDVKSFSLTACFIKKCDTSVMTARIKIVGHRQQCTIMYEL